MSIYSKQIDDDSFQKYRGCNFDTSWYSYIIDSGQNGYYIDSDGTRKVLFKFRKDKINKRMQTLAIDSFLQESKKKHSNRGLAGGIQPGQKTARHITKTGQNEGRYISSNISGYYDRALREHRGLFNTEVACRTTAFTNNNIDKWNRGLEFIQKCSREYSKLGGKYYKLQKDEWNSINNNLKIPNTVFTTITSNYNWRTACHKDTGDYNSGLGNLIVVGHNFVGGYLGFPQFKVLIKIKPGDFLLMDVHQWHCNTALKTENNGFRLSFVMYIRQDMSKCKKLRIINNIKYHH